MNTWFLGLIGAAIIVGAAADFATAQSIPTPSPSPSATPMVPTPLPSITIQPLPPVPYPSVSPTHSAGR